VTAWYEESFGKEYLSLYAHRDLAEACANISAIHALLALSKDEPLLDLACGAGRCLVALRRAGFHRLVGLDLSADLLQAAAEALTDEGVAEAPIVTPGAHDLPEPAPQRVVLVQADMRRIPYRDYFATILSIFTSFGYFEADDENEAVLHSAYDALRPGGVFLMDYLSRDWVIDNLVPEDERRQPGRHVHNRRRLSPDGRRVEKVTTVTPDGGEAHQFRESVRLYSESDMRRLLAAAGFRSVAAYGSLSGDCCTPQSSRLVLVAHKEPCP